MNVDKLNEFAADYTAAWNSQNAAGVSEFFTEDGTLSGVSWTRQAGSNLALV